jgi:hypothetical protein
VSFGTGGTTVTGPHAYTQTGSIFAAPRSVVFASDRIVLASRVGMRRVEGAQVPAGVYQLLWLSGFETAYPQPSSSSIKAELFTWRS